MSRRYSSRTIDAADPQAWYAHWWRDEWAEETLAVCERTYWIQRRSLMGGSYTTGRFKAIDEHFREWLVEKALEFRALFNPFTVRPDEPLETQWYRTLYANLTHQSRWHFWHYCREHGVDERENANIVWTTDSTDRLTEELGDAWIGEKYRANNDIMQRDPAKVLILLETILTGPTMTDFTEALKGPDVCEWEGCRTRKQTGLKRFCHLHHVHHIEMWGGQRGTRCAEGGCINYASKRDWCNTHYAANRNRMIAEGTWESTRGLPKDRACSVDECSDIVGERGRRGMCREHYNEWTIAQRPPCSVEGCDQIADASRGMCVLHYGRFTKTGTTDPPRKAPTVDETPCSVERCPKMVGKSGSNGRCSAHHLEWKKANADPCIVQGCTDTGWRSLGMCGPHYTKVIRDRKAEKKARQVGEDAP